jgi:hypothetical protein
MQSSENAENTASCGSAETPLNSVRWLMTVARIPPSPPQPPRQSQNCKEPGHSTGNRIGAWLNCRPSVEVCLVATVMKNPLRSFNRD